MLILLLFLVAWTAVEIGCFRLHRFLESLLAGQADTTDLPSGAAQLKFRTNRKFKRLCAAFLYWLGYLGGRDAPTPFAKKGIDEEFVAGESRRVYWTTYLLTATGLGVREGSRLGPGGLLGRLAVRLLPWLIVAAGSLWGCIQFVDWLFGWPL